MFYFLTRFYVLLTDFEDVEEPTVLHGGGALPRTGYPVNAEDGRVTLSETHFAELQRTIQSLNSQVLLISYSIF